MQGMSQASGTYGSMMKDIPANRKPGPTAGGAIMSGVGGATAMSALAGTEIGAGALTALGVGTGGVGLALGAALGIGAYLLS
ncbi:MAG TPA: hypothetical protein VGD14_09495 [bacterium]